MELSYLTFTPFEDSSIMLKDPLHNVRRSYDIPLCCDYLIDYQNSRQSKSTNQDELAKIKHWWERKWQVSLDYYLSSSSKQIEQQQAEPVLQQPQQRIDFSCTDELVIDELSSVQALLNRKTYRKFQDNPISLQLLSTLLSELKGEIFSDIWNYYVVAFNIKEIPPGIYRYCPNKYGLYLVKQGLFRNQTMKLLCGMVASLTASFLIILSIDLEEAMKRFPYSRALREIYIDSGRLAQKLLLKGMQHYVGGLPSPAMNDSQMCSFLDIDPSKCIPIYTIAMGSISEHSLNSKAII